MRLNPDCIRDVLLAIEDVKFIDPDLKLRYTNLHILAETESLSGYPKEDIAYTLLKLSEGNLIIAKPTYADGKVYRLHIDGMTFSGHQYLDKIRDPERWKKVKTIGGKVGDFSLAAIGKIAEGITAAAIDKFFR